MTNENSSNSTNEARQILFMAEFFSNGYGLPFGSRPGIGSTYNLGCQKKEREIRMRYSKINFHCGLK
jgi:hypothetical protein